MLQTYKQSGVSTHANGKIISKGRKKLFDAEQEAYKVLSKI
tara:strand:- start:1466 stop:1588 length:123 start_codon:yes stop_codon:yes gene_type:complete